MQKKTFLLIYTCRQIITIRCKTKDILLYYIIFYCNKDFIYSYKYNLVLNPTITTDAYKMNYVLVDCGESMCIN